MGVGIDCYRQRIGTFANSKPGIRIRKCKSEISRKLSNFFSNGRKTKVPMADIIIGALFYLTSYAFILTENFPEETKNNVSSRLADQSSYKNITTSTFCWLTSKEINKLVHTLNGNRRNPGYKYFAWNCDRGYLKENKLEDVKNYASRHKPNLMSISEVNLKRNENNQNENSLNEFSTEQLMKTFQIPGYDIILPESWNVFSKARILVYVNSELNVKTCGLQNEENHLQVVTLEVGFGRSKKHFVSFYYREWKNSVTGLNDKKSQAEDLTKLMNIWRRYTDRDQDFVSLGDMNICTKQMDNESYAHSDLVDILQEFLLSENCSQLTNQYTRMRSVNGTLQRSSLDHIISNCVSKMSPPEVHGVGKSDHLGIACCRSSKELRSTARTTKKRVYKHFDETAFQTDMRSAKESGCFEKVFESNEIDEATKLFTDAFKEVLDKHAPLKIIQNRVNYQPYVTDEIKKIMEARDMLKEKAAQSGDIKDHDEYKVKRNLVTYKMRNAEKDYFKEKFNNDQATSSELWQTAYSVLGKIRSQFPSQIVVFGQLVSKPIKIATEMNKFFIQKISDLKTETEEIQPEDPTSELKSFMSSKNLPEGGFSLREITEDEMKHLIKGLKGKKSCGLDWVCGYSLKLAATILLEELQFITNLSIRTSKHATQWKSSKVLPGWKSKGTKYDAKFYRPISNLDEISKFPERAVHLQTYKYLNEHNLIHSNHHGFLQNCSTATALQQIVDFWMKEFDKGHLVGTLLLDLSAGFDVIEIDILLDKLKEYKFEENTIRWFRSYLKDRFQCVQVESAFSPLLPVKWGVPQGSILGPLLFLIFINELPFLMNKARENINRNINDEKAASIVVFADDNTPMQSAKSLAELEDTLQFKADLITNWFTKNKMVVSGDKTKLLVVKTNASRQNLIGQEININVAGDDTEETSSEKILGVIVNNTATWKNHLYGDSDNLGLMKELSKRLGMLRKLRRFLTEKKFKMVLNGLFTSKLLYCITAWSCVWGVGGGLDENERRSVSMRKKDMRKLQTLQNKAMRILTNSDYQTPTLQLLESSKMLSVNQLAGYSMATQVFKIFTSGKPNYHYERFFGRLEPRHGAQTRTLLNSESRVEFKLSQGRGTFFYLASSIWNSLPLQIRNARNLQEFKRKSKNWAKFNLPAKV